MGSKTFGVIGLGSVGWAVIHGLSPWYPYAGYDIMGTYSWGNILATDIVFICVSTPSHKNGRLDCSAVYEVLVRLNNDHYTGRIVIKSTLLVGFMDRMVARFPALHLLYMPEFLRERSSFTWFTNPDRLVVSGTDDDVREVLSYFTWVDPHVPILHMSYISAEIGKLAHNAYIATKVSFTNEMEAICSEYGADAYDVMSTIWADRRVHSQEHLTPYLGPYGGKCVPKDTQELLHSGKKRTLLTAVEAVNAQSTAKKAEHKQPALITIIPTHNRPKCLDRALASIREQKKVPDRVYIVIDKDDPSYHAVETIVARSDRCLPSTLLKNIRSHNLSGAVNTALEQASDDFHDANMVFVSILDDDDWWDRSYLANVYKFAQETKADWIISGLIRHSDPLRPGIMQPIPVQITQNMFYVTNPNIQGSNLFVRLSDLINIGGFDEELISTTDRDVCIRLLDAGTVPATLYNHLVHHDADNTRSRLSSAGSEKKSAGLRYFYRKYSSRMNLSERDAFKMRSLDLFHVSISEEI
ncbi:glycosyltransferase [Methanofollis sp. UBA420]|jgi:UDPglucose 6-dehydrogenase|uniref:glycosyltransferase n=1 Tax=Methanofollis sp. UBA420 TaxID=1915514 RepID=UPI00316ADCB9